MDCEEIKKIIPKYFQHTASDEEIQAVEEHLCVCHDCRIVLGELMDKAAEAEEKAAATPQEEIPSQDTEQKEEVVPKEQAPQQVPSEDAGGQAGAGMEYFPGEDIETSLDKVDEVLGSVEPAKDEPGEEPKDKEEAEAEDSSFEVISEPLPFIKQELPKESDLEILSGKEAVPSAGKEKEPVKPESPWKSGIEVEEETVQEPAKSLNQEDSGAAPEAEAKTPQPAPAAVEAEASQEISGSQKEPEKHLEDHSETVSLEEVHCQPEALPLGKTNSDLLEYFCLICSLAVLGFLIYLFLKG